VGCLYDEAPRERRYTIVSEPIAPVEENQAKEDVSAVDPAVSEEKIAKPIESVGKQAEAVERYEDLRNTIRSRGLRLDDLGPLARRLAEIDAQLRQQEFAPALVLIRRTKKEVEAIEINEDFIAAKNGRLLNLIQEVRPPEAVVQVIDQESAAINQLLEQGEYVNIHRRMNRLFDLLEQHR
jgi:hypothetical protein